MLESPLAWTNDQLALLGDTRLPAAACRIGLAISLAGPGGVEVSKAELAGLLGPSEAASDDTIARHLKRLEMVGWLRRESGGRGHSDRFVFIEMGPTDALRSAFGAALSDRYRSGAEVNAAIDPHPSGGKFSSRSRAEVNALSSGSGAEVKPPSSSSTEPPPPPPLDARARDFLDRTECLVGCRGSLVDYLTERVECDRQLAYVQTVVGIIEGTDERLWKGRNGKDRVTTDRPKIIAGCLNELRQGDEVGKYFPGSPGDIRNLQSKIRYKVKAETDAKRDTERRAGAAGAPGKAGAEPRAGTATAHRVHVEG